MVHIIAKIWCIHMTNVVQRWTYLRITFIKCINHILLQFAVRPKVGNFSFFYTKTFRQFLNQTNWNPLFISQYHISRFNFRKEGFVAPLFFPLQTFAASVVCTQTRETCRLKKKNTYISTLRYKYERTISLVFTAIHLTEVI